MAKKSYLYIDESGKASLADFNGNYFILTGVILDDEDVLAVEGYFNYIKRKFKLNINKPFHSYHIFEHPEEKIEEAKALDLSTKLADYLSIIPVDIRVVVIEKDVFRKALGIKDKSDFKGAKERKEIKDFPYRIMSTCLFGWFADYLDHNKATGQIIADSRRGSDHQLIKTLNLCKEGAVPIREKSKILINEKIKALTFAEKDFLSGGLEITDLVSYISFFRVKREISTNSNLGFDKIWKELKEISQLMYLSEEDIKRFFQIKKDEVYKHLK